MDRLEFLKRLGALTVGASFMGMNDVKAMTSEAEGVPEVVAGKKIDIPVTPLECKVPKPVTMMSSILTP